MWQQWANGVLGLLIILGAFTIGITEQSVQWTVALAGLVVAILGFWGAAEHLTDPTMNARHA